MAFHLSDSRFLIKLHVHSISIHLCVCVWLLYRDTVIPVIPAILAVSYHYDQAVVIPLSAENLSHCQLSQCSGKKNTLEGEASLAIHGWKFQISSPPAAAAWRL